MNPRATRFLVVLSFLVVCAWPAGVAAECEPTPETIWNPAGFEGCELDGPTEGVASVYPGQWAATNWCTWTRRTTEGCGLISVQSVQTGVTITVAPGEFCHCWWGVIGPMGETTRLVDLIPSQVLALGLDPAAGLFDVVVTPIREDIGTAGLPDTSVGERP